MFTRFIKDGEPVTKFVAIVEPYTVDALGIFSAIKTAIISLNNTEEPDNSYFGNLCSKLINVNFDGASVMSGHISGVQKRFKDLQGGLVYTHCVAHRLELAILDAIKFRDGYLEHFDEVINNIFKFYFISAVRRKDLRKIGDMFADEFKQSWALKKHQMGFQQSACIKYSRGRFCCFSV